MANDEIQVLGSAIAGAMIELDDRDKRIAITLYKLLAAGDPVDVESLAGRAGAGLSTVRERLDRWPGVFRDPDDRVVGFWGLAIPEMAHRFQAEGGKPMHAWCALDPFLIVPVIGRPARVDSTDPVTGGRVSMTVTPTGVVDVDPPSAVVSFLAPLKPFDHDVIQSFCHHVLNFSSRESAERWASDRDDIVVLPVSDAFEVGLLAWSTLRGTA